METDIVIDEVKDPVIDWKQLWQTIVDWCASTGLKILISIVVLFISFKVINFIFKKITKNYNNSTGHKKLDKTLFKTFTYVAKIVLKTLVVVGIIGYLGIDTSGITALIASVGVAVGLAINGAVANIAGGVLLLVTRPFKDDDYIAAAGYEGMVQEIRLCNTVLLTFDNRIVYIPNGTLSTSTIINYTEKDVRRVDLTFTVTADNDLEKVKTIIKNACVCHPLALADPETTVRLAARYSDSMELVAKIWVRTDDYWTVYYDAIESVKKALDENNIAAPSNQMDVHVRN